MAAWRIQISPQANAGFRARRLTPGRMGSCSARAEARSSCRRKRAFTLIELLVVVAILSLVVAIAVPAMGPMLASNQEAQAISILSGILTTAQTRAAATGTAVGIRFERAIEMHERDVILDYRGRNPVDNPSAFDWSRPAWQNFQRARLVEFATGQNPVFTPLPETRPYKLPKGFWVAPSSCLDPGSGFFSSSSLAEGDLIYDPKTSTTPKAINYNLLDTFFVVFDSQGELTRFDSSFNYYADHAERWFNSSTDQVVTPIVSTPDESARALLLYDRARWESINPTDGAARLSFLQSQSRSLYISRISGAVIQEVQP